jgi:hypothetical protein
MRPKYVISWLQMRLPFLLSVTVLTSVLISCGRPQKAGKHRPFQESLQHAVVNSAALQFRGSQCMFTTTVSVDLAAMQPHTACLDGSGPTRFCSDYDASQRAAFLFTYLIPAIGPAVIGNASVIINGDRDVDSRCVNFDALLRDSTVDELTIKDPTGSGQQILRFHTKKSADTIIRALKSIPGLKPSPRGPQSFFHENRGWRVAIWHFASDDLKVIPQGKSPQAGTYVEIHIMRPNAET